MNQTNLHSGTELPAELRAMLAALREEDGNPPLPDIDWNQFLKRVRHHRVYPQLQDRPRAARLIPADVRQAIDRECGVNALRMLRLSGETIRLCRELESRGVRSLVLKGPALARHLYGDVSRRTSKDLDLLIPVSELEKAGQALRELGYVAERDIPKGLGDWKWKIHHIAFRNPKLGIEAEIHWRLNGDGGREPSFEELWAGRQISDLAAGLAMPGDSYLFLYLITHGARHGWFRLRWLMDIDKLARRELDWLGVAALLKRYRAVHLAGQALVLSSALLGTPVPEPLRPAVSGGRGQELARRALRFIRDDVVLTTDPSAGEVVKTYKSYLFALKTRPQKGLHALRRLYPSFRDAETLPLPRQLYFLYFPLRPFVWLWRQVRQIT
ncbi:nucleotidyltransferase domain-containing protein [Cohnella fermenti]|uniref:Renal dipeptidase n=1 Tax=Cohnella fermenti TaxID=2565925 RepID=A0A4S4BGS3_9BACL|nr:nucleotidyltransferase family protein [Cohnella fermenti]THF73673.1 Renal dipeptidase [Cohnella fermenti]